MSKAWKQLDLEGAGLQTMNARLTRDMRRRPLAYGLALAFPLGLHRFYLREPRGGAAYLALTLLSFGLWMAGGSLWALVPLGVMLVGVVFDLFWMDGYITRYNKALRMRHFLRPGHEPPRDYRGRVHKTGMLEAYQQQKEQERAGHQPMSMEDPQTGASPGHGDLQGIPSFNEQEAMLRELARSRNQRRVSSRDRDNATDGDEGARKPDRT
ncbi:MULTISPECIES: TM2 domain-containing protein [unclassified Ectothiorhodospira]|uniref:TM2 domain-containing protein n=1 Tax=unclassified Ectothiorhodospira TaxID=2684909 RepID=UPI001EE84EBD|nr:MULTISPECIES: TM2 domain-containing protein [unclassified Ectothiorhodospira]MCG5516298.1 TM2 domain-containing protein [Ectothiorhodospira sp. 9100]MCG5519323.1 TM2 domain-containing protein [Ectothiorhodospira sp. 9905]